MEVFFDEQMAGRLKNKILYMRHGNEELLMWEQKKLSWNEQTFRDLNKFWAFLQPDIQASIFQVFRNVRNLLDTAFDFNTTVRLVNEQIIELYKLHPLGLVEHWMRIYSDVRLPADLKTELQEDDRPEQTYLEADYRDLTVLTIALKAMVPIWSEFLAFETAMSDMNKEIFAIQLLQRTEIMSSPALERFREFVETVVSGASPGMKSIIYGIGSVDIPEWTLAFLVVSKLSTITLSHLDDEDQSDDVNVIRRMWSAIRTQLPADGGRGGKDDVKAKTLANDNGGDEDNLSTAESYKVRESISDGERVAFDYGANTLYQNAPKLLGDNYDRGLLWRQIQRNFKRKFFNPTEAQLKLAALVLAKFIPTRALPHTERNGAVLNISMAQIWLHQHGFSVLADLLGGEQQGRTQSMFGGGQISTQQMAILRDIYPYVHYTNESSSRTRNTQKTPGEVTIGALFDSFANFYWQRDVDDAIAEASTMIEDGSRGFMTPPNFKTLLADFIIFINTQSTLAKP